MSRPQKALTISATLLCLSAPLPSSAERAAKSPASGPPTAQLVVDCRAKDSPISPYIYGVAGGDWELGMTSRRWGGNPTTRYNWQLGNAWNAGADWFFENQSAPDYRQYLAEGVAHHVGSALTVPLIGWVAKDKSSYGFPISVHGDQRKRDPYRQDAGDGFRLDNTPIRPTAPTQTSVELPPESLRKWVESIRAEDRVLGERQVQLYILDNEPSLWDSTHRDVHPDPVSYDELLDRTIRYGSAIRAADPQALIAGPAEWGWTNYFYSAVDRVMGFTMRPDRRAHGDVPLIPWYLKKLREYERKNGTRILDVLDVHFYPQGVPAFKPDAGDPDEAARRIRSTRALWDPSYKDESWINDTVRLIPRLREWVAQNSPGLKLSIGEYNFGAVLDMNGALALAEALGRFGTEGLDYAYYWHPPPKGSPAFWAFRAYRDFDGNGGHFLERSLKTRMSPGVSLFASRDAAGKHLVLIALNLEPSVAVQARIQLAGCGQPTQVKKFRYAAGYSSIAEEPMEGNGLSDQSLPPYTLTVFDVLLK